MKAFKFFVGTDAPEGTIHLEDIRKAITQYGTKFSEEEALRIMDKLKRSDGGYFDYEEYVRAWILLATKIGDKRGKPLDTRASVHLGWAFAFGGSHGVLRTLDAVLRKTASCPGRGNSRSSPGS